MSIGSNIVQGLTALAKAVGPVDDGSDVSADQMNDALVRSGFAVAEPTAEKPRAMFHDPYSVVDWGGWRQRPSALTYETLRQMSVSNGVIAAIINTRVDQVGAFCTPQQDQYDKGYRVRLRDRRNQKRGMTPAEQQEAEKIERMLETTAVLLPNEKPSDRDSFRDFIKKGVRDILTYDQMCFEKQRDRSGRPSRFIMLPSETIRPAVMDYEHLDPVERRSRVSYVQVYENTVIAEFTADELAWCVKNPRSDIRVNGFGFSPIEQMVRLVTAWLFGFEYNTRFFTQGSAIKGLINIKGAIPDRQLRAFRRMWYSMITGVGNAWRTPIVNAEGLEWHSMHANNREMEYGQWMDWLTKLTCALYGMDPLEINFIYGNSGQTSSLNQSRPNAAEMTESKDKGLLPLLDFLSDSLNRHIIWDLNPDFEFSFTGYDSKAEEAERKAIIELTKSVLTVNEGRAKLNEEPLPGELGDVVLDTNWIQWATAKQQEAQMATQAMGAGQEGTDDNSFGDLFGVDEDEQEEEGDAGAQQGAPQPQQQPGGPPSPPKPGQPGQPPQAGAKPFGGPPQQPKPKGATKPPPFERSEQAGDLQKSDRRRVWIDHWLGGE